MNKLMKSLLLVSFFAFSLTQVFGQENPFEGKWELQGVPENAGIKFYKVFSPKGGFYNFRIIAGETIETHNGTYSVKDDSILIEIVSPKTADAMAHVSGQTTTIQYKFSEDKKVLTLDGLATNGNSNWHEVWKKVVEKPVAR